MLFRRVFVPVVLLLTLVLQFVPGTIFAPSPVAAASCNVAQFIADVTVPDGSSVAPGSTFVKTWRLKNIGSCTWTTSYDAVFISGDQMGAPASVAMPTSVAPGATVDISVNLTAPTGLGHYRGNWKLQDGSGVQFGVGSSGSFLFWVDIFVNTSFGAAYDFVANFASASWSSGAGSLPAPGTDGDTRGFVLNVSSPQLENGATDSNPGLVVNPQNVAGGYIQGVYPAFTVQSGDRFQSIVNCAFNATGCYVNFRLMYQIGSGPVQTFWSFNERYDGLYYRANVDLSSLAGQSVSFILYLADVSGHGTPSGDRAEWAETRIARAGSGPITPPSSVCDRGAFVGDVTIPDGSVVAPGSTFTKTWRIRNVGSCTWTTSYSLVFVFGDPLGVASAVSLPSSVAPVVPGATADFSVNMVAPTTPGHYRSYWRFRNASGSQFGVGSGMITFFADINVKTSGGLNPTTTNITVDTPDPSIPGQAVAVSVSVTGSSVTPTGTVTITGADTNCSLTLSGGSGTCNVVFNSAGAKFLTATYSGDANYVGSTDTESHTVNTSSAVNPSVTSITAHSPNPSTPGDAVTVSVTVSGSGAVPTGVVAITGANANCSITLTSGSGSCKVNFNSTGAKTLTATYGGDGTYATSSTSTSHTVNQGPTSTTITSYSPNPATTGPTAISVSVSVSGGGPIPTGTVAIGGADTTCSLTLSNGTGSCNVVFNTPGSRTLSAAYSGDGNYLSSSGSLNLTVVLAKAPTTTAITGDVPDPSTPGQSVVVGVSVSGTGATPTGTVAITGADTNCTITLAAGSGSCNVVFTYTGAKTIKAVYSGDANYAPSSDTESHTVIPGPSVTVITANAPNPSTVGQSVAVTVTVAGAGITPTGTVVITGADTNCTLTLSGGSGSCNVVFNVVAGSPRTITATYSGDMNYAGSVGTATQTVNQGTSATVITSVLPNPSAAGQTVTVSATVTGAGATPTGTVTVAFTGTGAPGACTITLIGGSGSCTAIFTTTGSFTVQGTYSGDANYLTSVSTVVGHVVN